MNSEPRQPVHFEKLESHLDDYLTGRPDRQLNLPSHITVFKRHDLLNDGPDWCHHQSLLIVPYRGDGEIVIDGISQPIQPGQALLVPPYALHHYSNIKRNSLAWLMIQFQLEHWRDLEHLYRTSLTLGEPEERCLHDIVELYTCHSPQKTPPLLSLECAKLIHLWLARNPKPQQPQSPKHEDIDHFLDHIQSYIHQNLHRPFSLSQLAQELHSSESHLRSKFKKWTRQSLGQYIRNYRLQRAKHLLGSTQRSIQDISQQCGYDNVHVFSRAFKKHFGQSPSLWRCEHA